MNVLTFLLALEVITLLLFILICNLGVYGNLGYRGFKDNLTLKASSVEMQHTLMSTILSFV